MAKPKPKNRIPPAMNSTQKEFQSEAAKKILELTDGSLYNIEKQDITYGKNKTHSWKDVKFSANEAYEYVKNGFMDNVEMISNRVFDKSGYSIEVKFNIKNGDVPGTPKVSSMMIALSDSIKRDSDGFIENADNSNVAYIYMSEKGIRVGASGKNTSKKRIDEVSYTDAGNRIIDTEKIGREYGSIDSLAMTEKISEELAKFDPNFPALFDALISNRDKQFVDAQPDNTTVLQDASNRKAKLDGTLNKTVTTENVKQTKTLFERLLGKNKEQEKNQGR